MRDRRPRAPTRWCPQPFVTGAPGNAALTRSMSAWVRGAEPMATRSDRRADRWRASAAGLAGATRAIIVGTRGEPGAAVASDGVDERARREARQQDDARPAGKRDDTGDPERVHVVERRGDEQALALDRSGVAREPLLGGPQRAVRGSAARPWAGPTNRTCRGSSRTVGPGRDRARRSQTAPRRHEGVERRIELHDGGCRPDGGRRSASTKTSETPASRRTCSIAAGGSLKLTGTATSPARIAPRKTA